MNQNRKAFLDMIAVSEIGTGLLLESENGYNVLVGGKLFHGYADHPRKRVFISRLGLFSTAAGRYQILARYFDHYKKLLDLPDFSPASQDAIALCMIREQGAMEAVDAGHLDEAIKLCSNIWASFPGAGYGQHEQTLASLQESYLKSGGEIAA